MATMDGAFAPRAYLEHYWPATHLDDECEFILSFLHEAHALYAPQLPAEGAAMVEVGGGPVIDKLISASAHVGAIYHLDPSAAARAEVEAFVAGAPVGPPPGRYDWRRRFEFVAALEGAGGGDADTAAAAAADAVETRLRGRIAHVGPVDLLAQQSSSGDNGNDPFRGTGLSPEQASRVRVVSSHSCAECIATSADTFARAFGRVLAMVPVGGLLVMTVNTNTTEWHGGGGDNGGGSGGSGGGGGAVPAWPVAAADVLERLRAAGFAAPLRAREFRTSDGKASEMESTLAVACVREAAPPL